MMGFYLVVALACLVLIAVSWRRSGSMTNYVMFTGAPIVWVLLGGSAFIAGMLERSDPETARDVFTGGLIGTGFVLVVLMRRSLRAHKDDHQD
ncbi:hypothetical protein [Angustibacter luteus]